MFCPKCGTNVNDGVRFCPVCGNDMAAAPTPAPMANPAPMMEPAPKNGNGLKIAIIAIIAVVVLAVVGVGGYFIYNAIVENAASSQKSECEECGDEFEGSGDLCDDCEEEDKKECEECGNKFEGSGPLCSDCKGSDINSSKECENCGNEDMMGEGIWCDDCIRTLSNSYCFYCDTRLDVDNIAVVDSTNFGYCKDCDTGYYCDDCGAPVDRGEDYCDYCDYDDYDDDYYYDDYYYDDYYYDDYYYYS